VTRIVVNTCHLAKRMADAVRAVKILGIDIVLSPEEELMGTAGGIALARERGLLGDRGPLLVINGDGALALELQGLADHHLAGNDLVTLALQPHIDPERWSRVTLDPDGQVAAIRAPGHPDPLEMSYLYPGVMVVGREALSSLPVRPGGIPTALWEPARSSRRLGGVVVAGRWREVGTPADYLDLMRARLAGANSIEPSAAIGSSAEVMNSFIGREAVVSPGAVVEDSIIAEGTVIGDRARVSRSILFGPVRVEAGEEVIGEFRASDRGAF